MNLSYHSLICFFLFFVLISCDKKKVEPLYITVTAPSFHLDKFFTAFGSKNYLSNEKNLKFDTLKKLVTITGTSIDFYQNGVYPYRFYDSIIYIIDPRTLKNIPQLNHLLYIQNYPADRIYVFEKTTKKLVLHVDEILWIADDECTFYFSSN